MFNGEIEGYLHSAPTGPALSWLNMWSVGYWHQRTPRHLHLLLAVLFKSNIPPPARCTTLILGTEAVTG